MKLFRCAWITISWPSCLGIAETQAADRARIMLKKGENFTFSIKINQLQVLPLRQRFESCWSLNFSSSSFCYFFNRPLLNYFWPSFFKTRLGALICMKMSLICMWMKNYCDMKGWAPTLALKKSPKIIWKWAIVVYLRGSCLPLKSSTGQIFNLFNLFVITSL